MVQTYGTKEGSIINFNSSGLFVIYLFYCFCIFCNDCNDDVMMIEGYL